MGSSSFSKRWWGKRTSLFRNIIKHRYRNFLPRPLHEYLQFITKEENYLHLHVTKTQIYQTDNNIFVWQCVNRLTSTYTYLCTEPPNPNRGFFASVAINMERWSDRTLSSFMGLVVWCRKKYRQDLYSTQAPNKIFLLV